MFREVIKISWTMIMAIPKEDIVKKIKWVNDQDENNNIPQTTLER